MGSYDGLGMAVGVALKAARVAKGVFDLAQASFGIVVKAKSERAGQCVTRL